MADIFDEVNEDLKRDQMQNLWSRFGKYLILVISIVVLGVGGRQGYATWQDHQAATAATACLLYTSPSPRDRLLSRMPSSA